MVLNKSLSTLFPIQKSNAFKAFLLLTRADQRKTILVVLTQLLLATLDLASVLMIGVIASLSLFGIQSRNAPDEVQQLISMLQLENFQFQSQVAILGIIVGTMLILKTIISAYVSKKTLFFLLKRAAIKSSSLLGEVLEQPYDYIKSKDSAELLYSLTRGLNAFMVGSLGSMIVLLTETSLLIVVLSGLMIVDPFITLLCIMYFGLISILQSRQLRKIAILKQGEATSALVESEAQILESFHLYRELHVRFARIPLTQSITETRYRMAHFFSEVQFLPYITKFTMELALVFGAILLAASQFLTKDALSALSILSIFLAASTRVTPSLLRLQQAFIRMKASSTEAEKTIALIDELDKLKKKSEVFAEIGSTLTGKIQLKNVSFKYRDSTKFLLENLNLEIRSGEFIALVGSSGNGKSTILDLIIGAVSPTFGNVLIDDVTPSTFISRFPGRIGYVSQESVFSNSSIRKNILLGITESSVSEEEIWHTLERVGLYDFVSKLPQRLDENVGERGAKLSVGQRQRLSLARALVTQPKILVLDEPTSALDFTSERLITKAIDSLRGATTIVVVAHRIETIKSADRVLKVLEGEVHETSFSQLLAELDGSL